MIIASIKSGFEGLEEQYSVRRKVFIEEQNISKEIEQDSEDEAAIHVLIYDEAQENKCIGTGRLAFNEDGEYILGRIAVLKEERENHIGELIVRKLIFYGFEHGAKKIEIHAQLDTIGFYEKIGFKSYGKKFIEAEIEHMSMYIEENMVKHNCCN